MTVQGKIDDAAALGFTLKKTMIDGKTVARWACTCSKCNTETTFGWSGFSSPELMAKNVQQAGWEYRRRQLVCPSCIEAEKSEKKMSNIETVSNAKLQRKVYNLLDDHFDEDRRLYRAGWSDKKVAEAAQTSEQFVASVRKGAYGELAEDPAVTALRQEIDALQKEAQAVSDDLLNRMSEISQKITALHTRLDGYAMKKGA